jgi:hypothetical protein
MNGLDGRGGVDGFSTTYDGPLPVSSLKNIIERINSSQLILTET